MDVIRKDNKAKVASAFSMFSLTFLQNAFSALKQFPGDLKGEGMILGGVIVVHKGKVAYLQTEETIAERMKIGEISDSIKAALNSA